jgi:hypothetical protein
MKFVYFALIAATAAEETTTDPPADTEELADSNGCGGLDNEELY